MKTTWMLYAAREQLERRLARVEIERDEEIEIHNELEVRETLRTLMIWGE